MHCFFNSHYIAFTVKFSCTSRLHHKVHSYLVTVHSFVRTFIVIKEILMDYSKIIYFVLNTCFFKNFSLNSGFCCFTHMNSSTNRIEIIFYFVSGK